MINPVFDATGVIKVVARAVKFSDHIVLFEGRHTNNALVVVADGSKQVLRKLDPRNGLDDPACLRAPLSLISHPPQVQPCYQHHENGVQNEVKVAQQNYHEHQRDEPGVYLLPALLYVFVIVLVEVDNVTVNLPN